MSGLRLLLAAALAGTAVALTAQPARDQGSAPVGTGSISGTVYVDGATKQPARRVRVTLTSVTRSAPGQTATTDDKGAFVFRGVPAGQFELQAFRNGYLRASYGAARPDRAGTPIVVKDGETVSNLTMTIARGGVIAGTVRDLQGQPVPGVNVRVLRLSYNAATGERTLGVPSWSTVSPTDDRGEYRAFGLPPGGYLVLANPAPASGRSGDPDIRPLSTADVQRAFQSARAAGPAAAAGPQPAIAATPPRGLNYAPIFHPAALDIGNAATITIGVSEERTGVDVVIQLVPTATISGKISAPSGALPPMLNITAVPSGPRAEMLAGAGLRALSAIPRPDGTYVITGVPPGAYTIKAAPGRGRGAPAPDGPTLSAAVEVTVTGQDLDVPLILQPGVAISGRVVFEGAPPPTAAELQTLSFVLVPPNAGGAILTSAGGRVDADGRFTFASITPDVYRFLFSWTTPGASQKWTIKSSTANGRESYEAPLRVNANEPVEWTITFTDRPTHLTGMFQDRSGRAATDYYVLIFSSDRTHWVPGSRRIRMTRPATDGAFSTQGLPPGEYYLAALADLEAGEWNDPALLEQLVPFAITIRLREGQTTTQDVRIGG
jgi:carboxypeptidase family protein